MNLPYITPEKLLSRSNLPIKVDFAFVCFCPMPFIFENFKIDVKLENRLFLHTHNSHILFGEYQSQKFIVVSEVYGGPIGVTTVEELKYYGVKKIIGLDYTYPSLNCSLDCIKTCIWTTNALYREYRDDILFAIEKGCKVVNMDTSHLYASCKLLDIECAYYAVVSDVINIDSNTNHQSENKWDNDLTTTINGNNSPVSQSVNRLIESLLASI
ncbi:purine phosphorylase family 1 protein [Moumouvirus australiensis]|uniref:Purine phosphorylase family 1 protein n=1 Tax=Moumouvirus australiensis TaxID=2109587 RepID=A0A2P1EMQ5_9VIRU|nr:purine phosphorylase family 1 protein [Moumouvirus australiensis]AVL95186.1 purine phosphorylase family 1 protein [Moumouvirus australiensis]